ncbi:cofactor assembly of complex C subunit B [Leptodesmis sp.]|uniref:cofactor assembly of complex C subunit B n=1 Tax=Leptodesmis sp. TaxID=3100501 RepID=UPI0040534EB8
MDIPVLSSTFLLTMLLGVGLFFFIQASVKDRTQSIRYGSDLSEESLISQLQRYFAERSYQMQTTEAVPQHFVFEGIVRPSVFLAVFLTLLATIGLLCLALVLAIAFPHLSGAPYALVLISPLAGLFYWQRAKRPEQVLLRLESDHDEWPQSSFQSFITITAHRDELIELERALPLKQAP